MPRPELRDQLVDLFAETAASHQQAFAETNGEDPDWPIWYADHLRDGISDALDHDFNRAPLIYCLMSADFEHQARAKDADWKAYWADFFIERYAASDAPDTDRLSLYYMPSCPFCQRVLRAMKRLGLDIELRDINVQPKYREELIAARGRATVPVLRIDAEDGPTRWMPESLDIIDYLKRTYGDGSG